MTFDPQAFMNASFTGANETKFRNVPAGEYAAFAKKVDIRTPKDSVILDIQWAVDDAAAREATGQEEPLVRQSVFLDMDGGNLALGPGKNITLGKLRAALGLNDPSKPFSFGQIVGRPARIRVEHTPDKNDPEQVFANVKAVTKL